MYNARYSVDAYSNERFMILKEQPVDGRTRMMTEEERVLRGGWREIKL